MLRHGPVDDDADLLIVSILVLEGVLGYGLERPREDPVPADCAELYRAHFEPFVKRTYQLHRRAA